MSAIRKQIEDAVISQLQTLKTIGAIRTLKPYNGELTLFDVADVKKVVFNLPAVLVFTGPGRFKTIQIQRRRAVKELSIELYVIGASLRSREEVTRNDVSGGPDGGLYRIIEQLQDVLFGVELGVSGVGRMVPLEEIVREQRPELTIWQVTYTVDVDERRPDPEEDDITEIAGNTNLAADEDDSANPVVQTSRVFS